MKRHEEWVVFDSLPNYAVSNYGDIRNLRRETLLTPSKDANGYFRVALYHKGVRHDVMVHRMVARAYLPDYEEGLEVLHKNRDKSDNWIDNLAMGGGCRVSEALW